MDQNVCRDDSGMDTVLDIMLTAEDAKDLIMIVNQAQVRGSDAERLVELKQKLIKIMNGST